MHFMIFYKYYLWHTVLHVLLWLQDLHFTVQIIMDKDAKKSNIITFVIGFNFIFVDISFQLL